ncbi:MAG: 4Fe-4S binding protein [Spirochaetes bacterium]|nr:4Fe-4S binding protein [Spirochaetota bacterium]
MPNLINIRIRQGTQYVPDVTKAAVNEMFRGFPIVDDTKCDNCDACTKVCPSNAITAKPLAIDMGKCVFCGDCVRACSPGAITFTNRHHIAADAREKLVIKNGMTPENYEAAAVHVSKEIRSVFGRSLKLRSVSAGGCNACEMELNASNNVNFDMGRFGIDIVASPRHADGMVITGPVSGNMAYALEETYRALPTPKLIILFGSCAISGGVFADSKAVNRSFIDSNTAQLYVPGCPVHPLTFINGLLRLIGRI